MLELPAADDQQPVEALAACAADPAFHVGVRVRGLHGVRMTLIFSPARADVRAEYEKSYRSTAGVQRAGGVDAAAAAAAVAVRRQS